MGVIGSQGYRPKLSPKRGPRHRFWVPGAGCLNFDAAIMENMDYRGGPPPIMRNALRNDRGAGSLEYLGIIIVALVTVGAIIAAVGKFDLGEKIACQVQQLGTAQASCAGGGSSDAPTQADRAPRGQQPAGVANPGEGNGQKGETHSSSGGAQYYRGATKRGQDVDTAEEEDAADAARERTSAGVRIINKPDHYATK